MLKCTSGIIMLLSTLAKVLILCHQNFPQKCSPPPHMSTSVIKTCLLFLLV